MCECVSGSRINTLRYHQIKSFASKHVPVVDDKDKEVVVIDLAGDTKKELFPTEAANNNVMSPAHQNIDC